MSKSTVIKLTDRQYAVYNENEIEIQAPDGTVLAEIGALQREDDKQNGISRLYRQASFATSLLQSINEPVRLSVPAAMGLFELLDELQHRIEELKKIT